MFPSIYSSRQPERLQDGFGFAIDDEEIGAGGAFWDAAALLPVSQVLMLKPKRTANLLPRLQPNR